jgi:preprotein translocase subunit SecE
MATLGTQDDTADTLRGNIAEETPAIETGEESGGFAGSALAAKPLNWIARIRQFWHEVALEMKKVSWPARTEVVNTTVIVVVAVFFFAAYLFVADILFTYIIQGLEWGAQKLFG